MRIKWLAGSDESLWVVGESASGTYRIAFQTKKRVYTAAEGKKRTASCRYRVLYMKWRVLSTMMPVMRKDQFLGGDCDAYAAASRSGYPARLGVKERSFGGSPLWGTLRR
jgi:hypothetical protein